MHQVRTYVNAGLVKPCATTPAGYFLFGEDCVTRLRLIGAATRAGLYLREIADLVHALDGDDRQALNAARRSVVAAIGTRHVAIERLEMLVSGACGAATTMAIT